MRKMTNLLIISLVSIAVAMQAMDFSSITQKLNKRLIRKCFQGGSVDEVKALLDQGAELTVTNNDATLLHLAAGSQNYDLCVFLIEQGINVLAKDKRGMVALHAGAYMKHKEICELLLDKGTPVNVAEEEGFIPLHLVCMGHDSSPYLCQFFLDREADLYCSSANGITPLCYAIDNRHSKVCKALVGASMLKPATQEEVTVLRKSFIPGLWVLKQFNVSKDMRNKILESDPDLLKDRVTILYYDLCNGHTLTSYELSLLMRTIPGYTFEMVKPLLQEELKDVENIDDEIKKLLDSDMLEENFGETITTNISKKLLLLQEKATMNEINK